jgi:hypothetical protein
MADKIYAFPDVGRSGLGNMLFPWARAEVFRMRHGVPMLAPQWTQPKIGPLLRGEKDKRYYVGLFDNAHSQYVRGLRKYLILNRSNRVPQAEAESFITSKERPHGRHVVVFSGWEGWFDGIVPHRAFVSKRLHEILTPSLKARLASIPTDYEIAVHVRRGDKPVMPFGAPFTGEYHGGMANEWFINCINAVRAVLGETARVKIFTDASDDQIRPILDLPNVSKSGDNPSIVDIFLLSRGKVLITTGTSSFSAWASYVGGMPTIWYPGLRLDLNPDRAGLGVESDLEGKLPPAACDVVRETLR